MRGGGTDTSTLTLIRKTTVESDKGDSHLQPSQLYRPDLCSLVFHHCSVRWIQIRASRWNRPLADDFSEPPGILAPDTEHARDWDQPECEVCSDPVWPVDDCNGGVLPGISYILVSRLITRCSRTDWPTESLAGDAVHSLVVCWADAADPDCLGK